LISACFEPAEDRLKKCRGQKSFSEMIDYRSVAILLDFHVAFAILIKYIRTTMDVLEFCPAHPIFSVDSPQLVFGGGQKSTTHPEGNNDEAYVSFFVRRHDTGLSRVGHTRFCGHPDAAGGRIC
jgi:hypothetical protein